MENIVRIGHVIGILCLLLMHEGCGGAKPYVPPPEEVQSKIILVNTIYEPGFYVELDKKEAGYLEERLEIRVAPGKHKLKIFNKETAFTDKEETKLHKFALDVEVAQGEAKQIVLAWNDECYSCDIRKGSIKRKEEKKKGGRDKRQQSRPGMPGM